jgi:immune inhibitor A
MSRKLFYALVIAALLVSTAAASLPSTAQSSAAEKLPTIAIGSIQSQSRHLVAPSVDVALDSLKEEQIVSDLSSEADVQTALEDYYAKFAKGSRTWASTETQVRAQQRESDLAAGNLDTQAIQPVVANVFALAVDFSETVTEDVQYDYIDATNHCVSGTTPGLTGPRQGEIAAPPATDNNSLYYTPAQTSSMDFYKDIIFGYTGILDRVRTELTDPIDGQPGINLAGYTAQDYYDHVAGEGNVTIQGTVEGWVTVDHSEGHYGAPTCNDNDGGDVPVGQLVLDSVAKFQAANPTYYNDVSAEAFWPKYDANHDGVIDAFWIIHSGEGEEAGGGDQGAYAIWSHSWALSAQGLELQVYEGDPATEADDIYIDPYTMQPEISDVGVITEEFGHNFFGLPDLYTTDATNSIGFWSTMSQGSWGGYLGGSVPVGMPLWFKMIAQCGDVFCNWQEPMNVVDYKAADASYQIAQLEQQSDTPAGMSKGVRINLPNLEFAQDNIAYLGEGKGAWSGNSLSDTTVTLDYTLDIPASGPAVVSVDSYWFIEDCRPSALCDYGQVKISADNGSTWTRLDDGAHFDTSFGAPLLMGEGEGTLSFDLASYAGKSVILRFSYTTDPAYTEIGWFLDNLKLNDTLLSDFEDFDTAFTHSDPAWEVVPTLKIYPNYYLVEWRNATKYDQMVRTAYITRKYNDTDGWVVDRIPYNIPGALVYYRNGSMADSGYGLNNSAFTASPSIGPKLKLLVVDLNPEAMRYEAGEVGDYYTLNSNVGSYDAALTLQDTDAFTIQGLNSADGELTVENNYASKPAVTAFNDTKGYYAGLYYGPECPGLCWSNRWGSATIPARGDYSVRLTDYQNNPIPWLYGADVGLGYPLGDGNPGSNNVQHGVNIKLLDAAVDGTWGEIAVYNYSIDMETTSTAALSYKKYEVIYKTDVTNEGTEVASDVVVTWELNPWVNVSSITYAGENHSVITGGSLWDGPEYKFTIPGAILPGETKTVTLTASIPVENGDLAEVITAVSGNDGQIDRGPWFFDDYQGAFFTQLPLIVR